MQILIHSGGLITTFPVMLRAKIRSCVLSFAILVFLQACASTEELYADYDSQACQIPSLQAAIAEPAAESVSISSSKTGQTVIKAVKSQKTSVWEPAVFFNYKKTSIRPAGSRVLKNNIAVLQTYPGLRVAVRGSADKRGNAASNLALSKERVKQVVEFLTLNGVERGRIDTVAHGARYAGAIGVSERIHALHRRADLILINAEGEPLTEGLKLKLLKSKVE